MRRVQNVLLTSAIATAATSVATMLLGLREAGKPAAPLNATSHILHGDVAAEQDDWSTEYTLTGAVLNASAMVGWAVVQELTLGPWVRKGSPARAAAAGTATAALAYVTDYHIVPKRFTPGFEKRLSPAAMAVAYGVLAAALALGVRKGR